MNLRPYQDRGLAEISARFEGGARRVLAVAPTGAGKGTMAAEMIRRAVAARQRVLFLVHRREIVLDVANRVRRLGVRAGVIVPGAKPDPRALVQIASVQSLLGKEALPAADLLVLDEAHHYAADVWGALLARYPDALMVGLTATPQRADGRAMGDVFETLVVVATYSELLAAGHIVPCTVLRPARNLGIDLAQDPLAAYQRYANGTPALVYVRRVSEAKALAERFNQAGIVTAVVHAGTGKSERDAALKRLSDGRLTVIVNVYALTEGVDVPRVSTIILARTCDHESTFVQIVGRALRSYDGKGRALLLDLVGVSHRHGLPTDDRVYSLQGAGMGEALGEREGAERVDKAPEVVGLDLFAVNGSAEELAPDLKRERWNALAAEVEAGRMNASDAAGRFLAEFGERTPWISLLSEAAKARELQRLRALNALLGIIRYQEVFE